MYFYPRPPRGGRHTTTPSLSQAWIFLSTPSARRATLREPRGDIVAVISIHALREEGDRRFTRRWISTSTNFYPRPPRGGRPHRLLQRPEQHQISIHALREEGDSDPERRKPTCSKFLSTPSARRATAKTETKSLFSYKLYNILHEFRRALIYNGSKNYPNHAK